MKEQALFYKTNWRPCALDHKNAENSILERSYSRERQGYSSEKCTNHFYSYSGYNFIKILGKMRFQWVISLLLLPTSNEKNLNKDDDSNEIENNDVQVTVSIL